MHKQKDISLSVPLLVSSRHSEDQTCEFPMKKRAEKAMIGNSNKCAEEEKFFLNCNTCFSKERLYCVLRTLYGIGM